MAEINDWSTTAASNNSTPPDGWPENMVSSDVNDTAREGMAVIKRAWTDGVEGNVNSTGSAGAYIVAANRGITAYYDGMRIGFHANHANTGAATVDVDSVGAKAITKYHNIALAANDIETDQYVDLVYSASDDAFQLLTPVANAPVTDVSGYGSLTASQTWTELQLFSKGADVASASPLVLGTDGNYFDVTGTTGFSQITVGSGALFMLQFDDALTLTHGATLDLPGEANITTAAGDRLIGFAEAANTVQVVSYFKADGTPIVAGSSSGSIDGFISLSTAGADQGSLNVSGTVDNGVGDWTVTWDTDFSDADYTCTTGIELTADDSTVAKTLSKAVGSVNVVTLNTSGSNTENSVDSVSIIAAGV